jgi:hypothetical protein
MGYIRSRLHPVTRTPDFILRDHQILISLDGFDTLATADGRDLVAACNRLHAQYSKAHYYSVRWENYTQIVTSRCYITIARSISGEYYIYTVHSEVGHPCCSLELTTMLTVAGLCSRLSFRVIQYPCCNWASLLAGYRCNAHGRLPTASDGYYEFSTKWVLASDFSTQPRVRIYTLSPQLDRYYLKSL